MTHVAVLIGPSQSASLTDSIVDEARSTLDQHGAKIEGIKWLSPHEAVEISFAGTETTTIQSALKQNLTGVDIAVLPKDGRKMQLLIADMDSTIIAVECIDELADFIGVKREVAQITEAAMRGELDFDQALAQRVALLKDMPVETLERCFQERVRFNPGAKALVQTMRANGAYCALVSGGFTFFTSRVAESLGFHLNRANELGVVSGKLTGKVVPPISNAATKLETLNQLMNELGLEKDVTLAVGDGANDIPMMEAAGLSIAYHGKPKAQDAATFTINHGDLSALLYIQGYSGQEFHGS